MIIDVLKYLDANSDINFSHSTVFNSFGWWIFINRKNYKESRDNGQNVLLPLWVCNGTGTFVFHFVHCYVHGRAQQAQSAGASQPAAAEPSAVTVARSPPTPLQYHTGKRAKRLSAAAASAADANTAE